jgi:hypothetical protein
MAVSRSLQERKRKIAATCRAAQDDQWLRQQRVGGGLHRGHFTTKMSLSRRPPFSGGLCLEWHKSLSRQHLTRKWPGTWEKSEKSSFCLAFDAPPGYNNSGMGWEVHPETCTICLACLTYESEGYVGLFKFIERVYYLIKPRRGSVVHRSPPQPVPPPRHFYFHRRRGRLAFRYRPNPRNKSTESSPSAAP